MDADPKQQRCVVSSVDSDAKCNALSSPCFTGKFIGKKAFPFQIPSFYRTLRAQSAWRAHRAGFARHTQTCLKIDRIIAPVNFFGKK